MLILCFHLVDLDGFAVNSNSADSFRIPIPLKKTPLQGFLQNPDQEKKKHVAIQLSMFKTDF